VFDIKKPKLQIYNFKTTKKPLESFPFKTQNFPEILGQHLDANDLGLYYYMHCVSYSQKYHEHELLFYDRYFTLAHECARMVHWNDGQISKSVS
jgi:hypothetical protein